MIIPVETLTSMDEFRGVDSNTLERKLNSVEQLIRAYTNNNFQNRAKSASQPLITAYTL